MPEYIEKFNVVVASSTQYDNLGLVTGYTYKETIYPFVGLVYLAVIILFFVIIKKSIKN